MADVAQYVTPAVDHAKLRREDTKREQQGLPPRYAVPLKVGRSIRKVGTWESVPQKADRVWRLVVHSPGATSLNLGFTQYHMPAGGRLYVYTPDAASMLGPFTDADNAAHGELWTPPVPGDTAILEVDIPASVERFLKLELGSINHGYTDAFLRKAAPLEKSGACNVDVVCPEGDPWQAEIRSVAVISLGGSTFCTGFLVNNVREDQAPYFMTANHCGVDGTNAASLVVFWNFENSACRTPGSAASGGPGDGALNDFQSGAFFRAANATSDFTLVELDSAPAVASNVHWAGWDNTSANPTSAVGIHHPNTDEKRISFENDPLTTTAVFVNTPDPAGTHLRVADWDLGVTEPGSSGSPLFDQNHRVVGQLHGGSSACGNNLPDWYGRFSRSWNTGATAPTRLRDWLDPDNTSATAIDGIDQCTPPAADFTISPNPTVPGQMVTFTSSVSGGTPPYAYAWDLDDDGLTDCTTATCMRAYNSFYNGPIVLRATDAQPCTRVVTHNLSVDAPFVVWDSSGPATELCGDGDGLLEPGEQWRVPATVRNNGSQIATAVSAGILAQGDPGDVSVLTPTLTYPDLAPGAAATAPVDIYLKPGLAPCGATVPFDVTHTRWAGGGTPGQADAFTIDIGGGTGVQDVFSEDFEDALAFGAWTVTTGPGTHTGGAWARVPDDPGARPPGSEGYFAVTDSDLAGEGSFTSTILTSPVIDMSSHTTGPVMLEVDISFVYYEFGGAEHGYIEVFNGATWITVRDYTATFVGHESIDVTAQAAGNSGFRVRFSYQDANWDWWFAIDNLHVTVPIVPECNNTTDCTGPAQIAWREEPPLAATAGDALPTTWQLDFFGGPITENQVHFGIKSVLGSSDAKPAVNGPQSHTFTAPNIGTFDSPKVFHYIVRALDNGTQVLSPVADVTVTAGANPPTVTWVTPPPASAPSGGQFTVEWQVTNFLDPAASNAVGWGITSLLGQTTDQPGGNAVYSATVNVPLVAASGTLYYTAFAQNAIEFAFAPVMPVVITVP